MSDDVARRVATLEAQRVADLETVKALRSDMHEVAKDVRAIKDTVVRSRGFIAGASFVVVTFWTSIIAVVAALWDKWIN